MKVRKVLLIILAILTSGLMLTLALPLGEQAYLGWFAFVPILAVSRKQGFIPGLLIGIATTFVAAFLSVWGIFYAHRDPNGSSAWVYTGFGIFGFALSISIGAWADRSSAKLPTWWFAGLAVLLEAYLLIQLPAHLALTQYRQPWVLLIASLGGIWLVSFLLWWTNFSIATLKPKQASLAVIGVTLISLTMGKFHPSPSGNLQLFGLVQIEEPDERALTRYQTEVSAKHPEFVIWPEFAGIPFTPFGDDDHLRKLTTKTAAVVTSFQDNLRPLPHNVSALFSKGRTSARYAKRKLFGGESKMHTPGDKAVAVVYGPGKVGLNICFDSCYPAIIRDTAAIAGVDVIAVPSIDPYAANNFVSAFHSSYTPFRAAEQGVAFVKCDGMAYSSIVDPYGNIVAELPPGNATLTAQVSTTRHWTLYGTIGDWFLWLIGAPVGLKLLLTVKSHRRRPTPPPIS